MQVHFEVELLGRAVRRAAGRRTFFTSLVLLLSASRSALPRFVSVPSDIRMKLWDRRKKSCVIVASMWRFGIGQNPV